MENFKEKKLEDFTLWAFNEDNKDVALTGNQVKSILRWIEKFLDETETNLFLKDIVTKARIDTLKAVLPEENEEPLSEKNIGWNNCRNEVINKAKELWNIQL